MQVYELKVPVSENEDAQLEHDDRQGAEQAIRQAEEYRDLFNLANDPILIFEPEGEIVLDVNDKACQVYGIPREAFIGRSMRDMSLDVRRGEEQIKKLLAEGAYQEFETTQYRADGTPINFLINSSVIEYQGRLAVLSINRDITQRKLAEEALRQSEGHLRQSQKMEAVGQLAGGIAHDFNNLIAVILLHSELMLRDLEQDCALRRRAEEIRKAADRAASLTRQLLAFSRKQVLQPKVLDLNAVVADMNNMLRRLIGEHIELLTATETELGKVKADPGQIEQVIMNLVVNARDAMPRGGRLAIETANVELDRDYTSRHIVVQPGRYVMLAVSDTGDGMDAQTQARIFEPFFTTKEQGKGTGLGLSTVYGIVKQSGGNIWVYSEVGLGTTFKIYLPRVDQDVEQPEQSAAQDVLPQGTETVLLVEDEEMIRKAAREILEVNGYRVLEASSGKEALFFCQTHKERIDLMITDVVMPQIGGRELAEQLKPLRPGMKVLYMSGYTDDAIAHHGVLDEGTAFLEKPFTASALSHKVREVLAEHAEGLMVSR